MNDFLQSLRNGNPQTQRPGMTRKTYDHTYHSTNQQFQYYNKQHSNNTNQGDQGSSDRQSVSQEGSDASSSLLLYTIQNLSQQIETLASNQDQLIKIQEKTTNVIERQTNAIEKIIKHLELSPKPLAKKQKK